jgi:hypothetical protein
MSQPVLDAPPPAQSLPLVDLHIADPPPPPSTLGQTPHEPKVRPWELELLISGALVFSMLQLPGQLDVWFNGLSPRLDSSGFVFVFLVWYYAKLAVYALAGGFSVHLAVRGYWVGVIGLEAVFPHGVKWENSSGGPIVREVQRRRIPTLQAVIDGADRFASLVFAGAFTLALLLAWALVIGSAAMVLAVIVARAFFTPDKAPLVMQGMLAILVGPMLLATLVDKKLGHRLPPDGRAARMIRGISTVFSRMQTAAFFLPLMMTLVTNLRGRRGTRVAMTALAVGGTLFVLRGLLMDNGVVHGDQYAWLPDEPGALGVERGFYEDRRGDGAGYDDLPSIQSDMVRDPYVRLFVPYRPRRHNALIWERCPGVRAVLPTPGLLRAARPVTDAAERAVLACMGVLQPVTLNGRAITPAWRFTTDPATDLRGIVAYIPVAGLPKGENLLVVARAPAVNPTPGDVARPPPPFAIPFWL